MFFKNQYKRFDLVGSSIILLLFFFNACTNNDNPIAWTGSTMGTTYQIKIAHSSLSIQDVSGLKVSIDSTLTIVNKQMSTYDAESEISKFNRFQDTTAFRASRQFVAVVEKALVIGKDSGYAFDITVAPLVDLWGFGRKGQRIVPPADEEVESKLKLIGARKLSTVNGLALKKQIPDLQIDLSAIAKGYGVDIVAQILSDHGFKHYLVEIGGEVVARGLNMKGELWKIGIDTPGLSSLPGQNLKAIIALDNAAVATSGDYRNYFEYENKIYSHTIDPKTGKPVTHNLASVTVITKDCITADGLATALMVLGKEQGLSFIEEINQAEAFMIVRKAENEYATFQSSGFYKYIYEP